MPLPPTRGADRAMNHFAAMGNRSHSEFGLESLGEWDRLLKCANQLSEGLLGLTRNFIVQPSGEDQVRDNIVWIRADLLEANSEATHTTRVVLKLRLADWTAVKHSTQPLKVLQSLVTIQDAQFVLDCTGIDSVVVSVAPICVGETVQVAEIFSGGFNGYAQAAYVLHRHGVPVHMRWSLDKDVDCEDMIRCCCPDTVTVHSPNELQEVVMNGIAHVHVTTNIHTSWWLRMFAHAPVNVVCLSPPCQPWSAAGSESGLFSDEGIVVLRAIEVLGALHVPVVVLEQVANFTKHPHYSCVQEAWKLAGYEQVWADTTNLLDVLPTQRMRHMAVYVHHTAVGAHRQVQSMSWVSQKRQTLGSANALFHLPAPILRSCLLAEEALVKYMDPWYVPPPRQAGQRPQTPQQYRIKGERDVAGTFLAQYQSQHLLPERAIASKGILGCLASFRGVLRFFAGPEIASLHGATQPILLQADVPTQMRLLGNSISVPHAITGLVYACCCLGVRGVPEPPMAVRLALQERIHCKNAALLPIGGDWVLCHRDRADQVIEARHVFSAEAWQAGAPSAFIGLCFVGPETKVAIHVPEGVPADALMQHLGLREAWPGSKPLNVFQDTPGVVHVKQVPCVTCAGFSGHTGYQLDLCTVLTPGKAYVVDSDAATTWSLLLRIAQDIEVEDCHMSLFSVYGQRLVHLSDFEPVMVAVPEDPDIPVFSLVHLAPVVEGLLLHRLDGGFALSSPQVTAAEVWLGAPFHLLSALGWRCDLHNFPAQKPEPMMLTMVPIPDTVSLSADRLQELWRVWLFIAKLEEAQGLRGLTASCRVEVQVVARQVWVGRLPGTLQLTEIESWWQLSSTACLLPSASRVFSGPFPQAISVTVAQLGQDAKNCVRRKNGNLLITVHPECVGGGAKTETANWVKTRAASTCLTAGLDLERTTDFVDKLATAAGVPRLTSCLQGGQVQDKWGQLTELAQQVGLACPVISNKAAGVANKLKKAQQRQKHQNRCSVKAADVCLCPGYFMNADGTAARVLDSVQPGATGVMLTDEDEAAALLPAVTGIQPDELCIVVLGHTCPDKNTCAGRLSIPAQARHDHAPLLLAGCYHNVGGKPVKAKPHADIEIDLPEVLCCTFEAFGDEFEPDHWQRLTQAPVKTVQEIFAKSELGAKFANPWGRQFYAGDRPALPASADKLVFQARVSRADLDDLLAVSGHNRVYIVPRRQDKTASTDFSIVWIGNSKAEAMKASLQVQGQLGIVRAKARFGIRVPAARFGEIFANLKPDQIAPTRVQVNALYRIGPVPAGAGATELQQWAVKAAWQVRVIKALGATHWLLGAASDPPTVYPAFNGQTVLITKVPPRQTQQPVVQSGSFSSRPSGPAGSSNAVAVTDTKIDPWLLSDPWSSYKSTTNSTNSFGSLASSAPAPKQLAGPTEKRLQAQEDRLKALEDGLHNLRVQGDERHTELVQQQQQDRLQTKAQTEQLSDRIALLSHDFTRQLQLSVESLQGAHNQQQQQVQTSIDELKQLLLASRDTEASQKKKPRHAAGGQDEL